MANDPVREREKKSTQYGKTRRQKKRWHWILSAAWIYHKLSEVGGPWLFVLL